jgi:diguanylate cyclase (GGDEF)-like protein
VRPGAPIRSALVSFRSRLGLFFVLIVIFPMVAVAFLIFGLLGKSERSTGRADVEARHRVALRVLNEHEAEAARILKTIAGEDQVLGEALLDGDIPRAEKRARQLLAGRDIERIVLVRDRKVVMKAGDKTAIGAVELNVKSSAGPLGVLYLSVIDAATYAREVQRLTGLRVVVRNGARELASTLPAAGDVKAPTKDGQTARIGGKTYGINAALRVGFPGQTIRVITLGIPRVTPGANDRWEIGAIIVGFLLLALACATLVSRSLQQQLAGFLDAARKLAGGDFSAQVTTEGKDEFAGLGEEFNKMARELKRRIEELREAVHESLTDDLTGLPNRRAFDVTFENRVRDLRRLGGTLGLVLLDLDDFKSINDTYGHPQGDYVLREFARVLHETSREIDHPARYGGEEFALLLPGTDLGGAVELAERVRRGIESLTIPLLDGSGALRVTVSCGVGAMNGAATEPAALVKAVDEALYEAKRSGKNKSVRAR